MPLNATKGYFTTRGANLPMSIRKKKAHKCKSTNLRLLGCLYNKMHYSKED